MSLSKDEMLEKMFAIITSSGESKTLNFEALNFAKNKEFDKAQELIKQSKEALKEAHFIQTQLINKEISGENLEVGLLTIHAEDHLMSSISEGLLIEELIEIYKKIL